jgi:hypothetical protein
MTYAVKQMNGAYARMITNVRTHAQRGGFTLCSTRCLRVREWTRKGTRVCLWWSWKYLPVRTREHTHARARDYTYWACAYACVFAGAVACARVFAAAYVHALADTHPRMCICVFGKRGHARKHTRVPLRVHLRTRKHRILHSVNPPRCACVRTFVIMRA